MGRIEEYDRNRRKRLMIILPLGIMLILAILISVDRTKVVEKIFSVGYEGPPHFVPEITIIDEKSIESEVTRKERHAMVAENVLLESDEIEKSKNPLEITSKEIESDLKDPSLGDTGGKNLYRTYESRAEVPFREDYVILKMVKPEYPEDALKEGLEGYVLVEAYVNPEGRVVEAWVQSAYGPVSFEMESLRAVRQFLFKPAMEYGKPIPFWVSFLIRFEFSAGE